VPIQCLAYVSGEGTRQKLLSLSLLLLPGIAPVLEVSESSLQVLDIILQLVNTTGIDEEKD
jgi:hypothetical protein